MDKVAEKYLKLVPEELKGILLFNEGEDETSTVSGVRYERGKDRLVGCCSCWRDSKGGEGCKGAEFYNFGQESENKEFENASNFFKEHAVGT